MDYRYQGVFRISPPRATDSPREHVEPFIVGGDMDPSQSLEIAKERARLFIRAYVEFHPDEGISLEYIKRPYNPAIDSKEPASGWIIAYSTAEPIHAG